MYCRHCGKEIEKSSKFCTYCGKSIIKTDMDSENTGSGHRDTVKDSEKDLIPASSTKRLINFFVDMVFYYLFAFAFGFLVVVLFGANSVNDENSTVLSLLAVLTYFVLFETLFGKSIAKVFTKTKVVRMDGTKPAFGAIILRSICRFIPFDIFSFFGSNPVGWHDSLSKTRVVDDKLFKAVKK